MKATSPVIQLAGTNLHGMPIFYPDSFVRGQQPEAEQQPKNQELKTTKSEEAPQTQSC